MPTTRFLPVTKFDPGGARGAALPVGTTVDTALVIYRGPDGKTRREVMHVVDSDTPIDGEVAWSTILEWTPAE